jgi:hypothetical protein
MKTWAFLQEKRTTTFVGEMQPNGHQQQYRAHANQPNQC